MTRTRSSLASRASLVFTTLIGALSLGACDAGLYDGGHNPPPPGGGPDAGVVVDQPDAGGATANAKPLFDSSVAPILNAKCSNASCHGGTGTSPLRFLPPTMTDYYDVVTSYQDRLVGYFDKTRAPIITKIVPGPHSASYTTTEAQAIRNWLDAELAARSGGGSPPPAGLPTPGELSDQLIREWSGCMSLTAWNEEGVASAWANKGSSEGTCIRCHVNGQASMIATDDSERMFNILVTNKYFMLTYFSPDVTDLSAGQMVINYDEFYRVGNSVYPHLEHPQFDPDSGDAMAALTNFYNRTMERKLAGTCDPPRLVDP